MASSKANVRAIAAPTFHKHPIVAPGRPFLVRSTNDQRSHPPHAASSQNQTDPSHPRPPPSLESDALLLKGNPKSPHNLAVERLAACCGLFATKITRPDLQQIAWWSLRPSRPGRRSPQGCLSRRRDTKGMPLPEVRPGVRGDIHARHRSEFISF